MTGHMFPKTTGTYGIIACSFGLKKDATTMCVICKETIPFAAATVGPLFANSQQAFACSDHVWNRSTWLREWAKFQVRQRQTRELTHGEERQ